MEEKMNNLSIGTAISILVIVLAILSIGSIILAFEACPSQALNFSNNGSEEALDRTKIGDIVANPANYPFDLVTVIGEYRGWQGEGTAPTVTRSDWVIKDDSGLIYVTGLLPGFDPVEAIGRILEVSGMVRVKEDIPYIIALDITLHQLPSRFLPQKGDCKIKDMQKRLRIRDFQVFDNLNLVRSVLKSIFKEMI